MDGAVEDFKESEDSELSEFSEGSEDSEESELSELSEPSGIVELELSEMVAFALILLSDFTHR